MAGLDVLLLEKTTFPREKVCGDGLTPRAVRELITLGIPHPARTTGGSATTGCASSAAG
jgi:flavin-dependent dehydrogenase